MTSLTTGLRVALDPWPQPGGDVIVYLTEGLCRWDANSALLDPTRHDENAQPTLYVRHSATCSNITRRRLAAEREGRIAPVPAQRTRCGKHVIRDRALITCGLTPDHDGDHE